MLEFSPGPERRDFVTLSGTSFQEPNSGNIIHTGGMVLGGGTYLPGNVRAEDYDLSSSTPISDVPSRVSVTNQFAGSQALNLGETISFNVSINSAS